MCGLTRPQDVDVACHLGVDAIGLVFYPPSPRNVSIPQAQQLLSRIKPFSKSVALFVDEQVSTVNEVLRQVPIDLIQFHGAESAEYCEGFGRPYLKVIKLAVDTDSVDVVASELIQQVSAHPGAQGFLLDSLIPGEAGGTGQSFSWSVLSNALANMQLKTALNDRAVVIAGGLTPDNCQQCVEQLSPYALDVSSGIESAKGIKDPERMSAFMAALKNAS